MKKIMIKMVFLLATLLLLSGVSFANSAGSCNCYEITYTNLDDSTYSGIQYTRICLDYENHNGFWDICDLSLFPGLTMKGLVHSDPCAPTYFKFHGDHNYMITGIWSGGSSYRYTFRGHKTDESNCNP